MIEAITPGSSLIFNSFRIFFFDMVNDLSNASSVELPFNNEVIIRLDGSRKSLAILSFDGLADHLSSNQKLKGVLYPIKQPPSATQAFPSEAAAKQARA